MSADSSIREDGFRSLAPSTVELLAGLVFESNRRAAEEVDQEVSTSSRSLAYKDPSLQNFRVNVIDPCCGMMACAATGAVVSAYEPVNL